MLFPQCQAIASLSSSILLNFQTTELTDQRKRVKAENSEKLMFLNYNLILLPEPDLKHLKKSGHYGKLNKERLIAINPIRGKK